MLRGRRAGIAAALAVAAVAAVTAGCGGGSTSSALQLDPVAAAATKTQNAGAARVRLNLAVSGQGQRLGMHGFGAIDGTSTELSLTLGSMAGPLAPQLEHAKLKEIALEQDGDYVIYLKLGFLSSQLPGGKQWVKLDLTTLGKSAGLDLGQLMSGSQLQPNDLLRMLEAEGAKVQKLGPATIDFERRIGSEVERFALVLLGARQLVRHAILRQKPLNQRCFLFSTSGEKPYGHPPLPYHARISEPFWTISKR